MVKKKKDKAAKYKGSWMKPYTWFVLSFAVFMILIYVVSLGLLGYRVANPLITEEPQSLSYELTKSEQLYLALSEENVKRFTALEEKEFNERQAYFHRIALEDQARFIKNRLIQAGVYLALWLLVFLVHRNMLARIRFYGV